MTPLDFLPYLDALDLSAVAVLILCWAIVGWRIENPSPDKPSVSIIMADYRREWMQRMIGREVRIFDAQTVGTLRQGTAFFASTSVIAIGGTIALIGNADRIAGLAEDFTDTAAPAVIWEMKLLIVVAFLTNAFLKFVWSNRLFGYCSVLMGAVPNDPNDPASPSYAYKAGELNIAAARSFNRGLRSVYFALASLGWLAGPIPLVATSIVTVAIVWRREFASRSRAVLLEQP
ncbi:DUF599 domain-containing protein [Sulfitobacter sp. HNIBRBA3233]|uniref:DUF599 domain-containing protein n=1 Tax=Sulfitobacter marinivivus TaxID=3158558 RepID=UPI0032DE5CB3